MAKALLSGMEYAGTMTLTTLSPRDIINLAHRLRTVSPIQLLEIHPLLK